MCFHEKRAPVARDLGFLDKRETKLINQMKVQADDTPQMKLLGYLIKAARRDEVSDATINAIKKLSRSKQIKMQEMAYKYLPPYEYDAYKTKSEQWFSRPTVVNHLTVKIPFGKIRKVQRAALTSLRDQL